jgi:hypothetical protein
VLTLSSGYAFYRPRHRWEDDIKMDLNEIGYEDVGWIHLGQH